MKSIAVPYHRELSSLVFQAVEVLSSSFHVFQKMILIASVRLDICHREPVSVFPLFHHGLQIGQGNANQMIKSKFFALNKSFLMYKTKSLVP